MNPFIDEMSFEEFLEDFEKGSGYVVDKVLKNNSLKGVGRDVVIAYLVRCVIELSESSGVEKEEVVKILFEGCESISFEKVYRLCNAVECFSQVKSTRFSKVGMSC